MLLLQRSMENHYKRWKISYDDYVGFEKFKNRVLQSFDVYLGEVFLNDTKLEREFIKSRKGEKQWARGDSNARPPPCEGEEHRRLRWRFRAYVGCF